MAASDQLYLELRADIDEVINELGTSYTVRAESSYDATAGSVTDGATRTVDGLVADASFTRGLAGALGNTSQDQPTWIGRKNLILKGTSNLLPNEEVYVDGKWWSLTKADPVKPADIVVIYVLDITS